ncbi:hypothetical protein [Halolamina sp.]|uniref:hypothetical protein n=1 Tax=Halolamina sp. TaxID=1940283 RepID=UPI003563AB30
MIEVTNQVVATEGLVESKGSIRSRGGEILQESATVVNSRSPYRRENYLGADVDEDKRLSVEQIEK